MLVKFLRIEVDSVKWNISLSPRREILTCFLVIFVQNWIVVILRKTVGQNVRTLDFYFECLDLNMFTHSSFDLRNFPNWMTSRHFAWLKEWSRTFRSVPRVRNIMLENSSLMLLSVTPENVDVFPKLCLWICIMLLFILNLRAYKSHLTPFKKWGEARDVVLRALLHVNNHMYAKKILFMMLILFSMLWI